MANHDPACTCWDCWGSLGKIPVVRDYDAGDHSGQPGLISLAAKGASPLPATKPPKCEDCGVYPADLPSKLCAGCEAYREHQWP